MIACKYDSRPGLYTELDALILLISRVRMGILLSLPGKNKAPDSVKMAKMKPARASLD